MDQVVSIIITYNQDADTLACLESLAKIEQSRNFKHQVVLVDNASQKPFSLPKRFNPFVELIRSESNLGFSGGNNLGIAYAIKHYQPDFFVLLNNDTIVDPGLYKALYARNQSEEKPGLISPKIYFAPGKEFHTQSYSKAGRGKVLWYAGGSVDLKHLTAFHRGVDEVDRGQFDQQRTSDFCTGCCLWIPRSIVETIGMLDTDYFLYFEDVDYSLRATDVGFPCYFEPEALLWHSNASSSEGAGGDTSRYYQQRNRLLFAFRYGNLRERFHVLRIALHYLLSGGEREQKAALDFLTGKYGKETLQ